MQSIIQNINKLCIVYIKGFVVKNMADRTPATEPVPPTDLSELVNLHGQKDKEMKDAITIANYASENASTLEELNLKDTDNFDDVFTNRVNARLLKLTLTALEDVALQQHNANLTSTQLVTVPIVLSQDILNSLKGDAEALQRAKDIVKSNLEYLNNFKMSMENQ